jgi:hypothetical protein
VLLGVFDPGADVADGVLLGVLLTVLLGVALTVLDGVAEGVELTVFEGVALTVLEGVADTVLEGVELGVRLTVLDGVAETVLLGVADGVSDGVAEGVAEGVALALGVALGVKEGVRDGVALGVLETVFEGVALTVFDGVALGVLEGVLLPAADSLNEIASIAQFELLASVPLTVEAATVPILDHIANVVVVLFCCKLSPVAAPTYGALRAGVLSVSTAPKTTSVAPVVEKLPLTGAVPDPLAGSSDVSSITPPVLYSITAILR